MYESFYGLKEKPFSLLPDPAFLYLSKQHEMAITLLEYSLENQAGFCVITGKAGTGKTTLLRRLMNQIGENISIGLITNAHHSFGELLRWILHSFNLDDTSNNRARQHQVFVDYLIGQYAKNRRTMLIIDEAQCMSSEALEELRMLSNINSEKDLLLQVILVGQPPLREILRRPELEQFAQRVAVDYHLESLSGEETTGYIRHRLRVAGGERELFTDDACEAVFIHSGGIPRLINLLCDLALVYAYAGQAAVVTGELIEQVVNEREQHGALPVFTVSPALRAAQRVPKNNHASSTAKKPDVAVTQVARGGVAPRLVGESNRALAPEKDIIDPRRESGNSRMVRMPAVRSEPARGEQKSFVTPAQCAPETNAGLAAPQETMRVHGTETMSSPDVLSGRQGKQEAVHLPVPHTVAGKNKFANAPEVSRDNQRTAQQSSVTLTMQSLSEQAREKISSASGKKDTGSPRTVENPVPDNSGARSPRMEGKPGRFAGHAATGKPAWTKRYFPAMAMTILISFAFIAWRLLDQTEATAVSATNAPSAQAAATPAIKQKPVDVSPASAPPLAALPAPESFPAQPAVVSSRAPDKETAEQAKLKQIESERDAALAVVEAVSRERETVRRAAWSRERALTAEHEMALARERERVDQLAQAAEKAKQQARAAKEMEASSKALEPVAPPLAVKAVESSSTRLVDSGLSSRNTEIETVAETETSEATPFTANPCKGPSARFLSTCE